MARARASRTDKLREPILAPGILVMRRMYDGFSARLVEAGGFADRKRKHGDRA